MSALSATLRIARRDALRAKARSALVVAMIALPVLGVGAADVLYRTFQLSPDQKATRLMGAADAMLEDTGLAAIRQFREGFDSDANASRTGPAPDPLSLLPTGTRLLEHSEAVANLTAGGRTVGATVRDLAYRDPLARGLFRQLTGREPKAAGEVALTAALAKRLAVEVGDTATIDAGPVRVVGLVQDGSRVDALTALVARGAAPGLASSRPALVDVPRSLTWADVERANAAGFVLTPRLVLPGTVQPPYQLDPGVDAATLTAISLVVGMVLLEIVLLAGPAFAVGAKRQSRELALIAATGAESRDIRRTVLGGGMLLGALGGLLGVLGGVALARLALPQLTSRTGDLPGPFEVPALELAAIVGLGVVTALLAAVIPARTAARQDVVAALTGRRGQLRSLRRTPILGLIAAVAGAALAYYGAKQRDVNVILVGSIVAELGLVATTPFLVGLVGRLSPRLPLGPRLALRDASRNRGRTAPAVSAVLAAVAGSVAVGTYVASLDRYDRDAYQPSAPTGAVTVPLFGDGQQATQGAVVAALRRTLPGAEVTALNGPGQGGPVHARTSLTLARPTVVSCSVLAGGGIPTRAQLLAAERDPACRGGSSGAFGGRILVGGPETLTAVTGLTDAAMRDALARGGAVVPAESVDSRGQAQLEVRLDGTPLDGQATPGSDAALAPGALRTVRVPAVALPRDALQESVVSPQALARVGLPTVPVGVVARGEGPPSALEEDRARNALQSLGVTDLQVERGYQSRYGLGLLALLLGSAVIVLGASGIATGLAAADGRSDLATLAAVGASPGTRRSLAAFQSAVTAGLGTLLGVIAGLVPAVGLVRALNAAALEAPFPRLDPYPIVLPWTNLAITVFVVPVLAAGAAALLTRSRLPMVRRMA